MNKREVNIKVLRQNFIKKHQLNPDYFTLQDHHDLEQLEFGDTEAFYPKLSKASRQTRIVSSISKSQSHLKSHSIPVGTTLASQQKISRCSQEQTKKVTSSKNLDLIIDKKTQIASQTNIKRL
jgi:hypothetical protein